MDEQKINKDKIDLVVDRLPLYYIEDLARRVFGRATARNKRKVKYWRSGNMQDKKLVSRLYLEAEKLASEYENKPI